MALGGYHSAAILADGTLLTWGWGGSFWYGAGALGHGGSEASETPLRVDKFTDEGLAVTQVACGTQHTLVLTSDGGLYSTGKGAFGLLGRGDTHDDPYFEEIDYFTQSNDSVLHPDEDVVIAKVDAGDNFSAVLSKGGELWVWGRNDYGQLGLGEEAMGDMYSAERYPRIVRSLPVDNQKVIDFACGEHHLVALTESGDIYEWGNRLWLEPHRVSRSERYKEDLKDIVKVAAGDKYSFALTREGRLFSWGAKSSGCLAQGEDCPKTIVEPTPVPYDLFGRQKVVDVAASKKRCLAITLEDELLP
jgi:alpha-tubulin suppressor-like RCC1 family protein